MTLVVDASVVAALIDNGPNGAWAAGLLSTHPLAAPHLLPVEATNILRRAALHGEASDALSSLAQADLLDLRITLLPFEPFAERVWELRFGVSAYDAWHVALAETLGVPLATLDERLGRAAGPHGLMNRLERDKVPALGEVVTEVLREAAPVPDCSRQPERGLLCPHVAHHVQRRLSASSETLLTPNRLLAPCADFDKNRYWAFSLTV